MKGIILVGGEGLRLRPLTCNVPKPMVPVVNKPFLEHVLDNLKRHHIDEIILAICYLPDFIQRHFGDGSAFGVSLSYSVEDTPLGTGGAMKNANGFLDDTFFVFNGDIFTDIDLTEMLAFHRDRGAKATIALTPVEDPTAYGVVETDVQRKVKAFIEKPSRETVATNFINAGTYILEPELLDLIPANTHHMVERGLFPDLVKSGAPFFGYRSNAYWIDIGVPADYLQLHHDILMGKAMARFPGKSVADDIWREEGCEIHPSAKIIGPVVFGRGCRIERAARISGPVALGAGCVVGEESTVDESVLWHNVKLSSNVTVKNSVVGSNTEVGNDTWIIDGSIVSDDSSVGHSNRLEHGIRIWPDTKIGDSAISF